MLPWCLLLVFKRLVKKLDLEKRVNLEMNIEDERNGAYYTFFVGGKDDTKFICFLSSNFLLQNVSLCLILKFLKRLLYH
jgi:hypothetical protein